MDLSRAVIEVVRDVARAEILPRFRSLSPDEIDTKSGPEDLVTVADRAAEARLTERLALLLPDATILGEESVSAGEAGLEALSGDGTVVVIDPIDGTWNFARGLATFGVILAIVEGGETVMGLLYDPVLDDWIVARRGEGAWYGRPDGTERRLSVRDPRPESEEAGYLPLNLFPKATQPALAAVQPRFSRVQGLRCSCHEYRMMAAGHVDWIVAASSNPWDHLAGRLVVTEAGGVVGTIGESAWSAAECDRYLLATTSPERLREMGILLSEALFASK